MRPTTRTIASLILAASLTTAMRAQTTLPATRPVAATQPAVAIPDEMLARLAPRYIRVAAGFSFCPPIGGKAQQKLAVGADEPFVTFASDEDRWTLKILQIIRAALGERNHMVYRWSQQIRMMPSFVNGAMANVATPPVTIPDSSAADLSSLASCSTGHLANQRVSR